MNIPMNILRYSAESKNYERNNKSIIKSIKKH